MPSHQPPPWRPAWHQRWQPIAWLRSRLRNSIFRFLQSIYETDDGRTIAAHALTGLLQREVELPPQAFDLFETPYPEIARAAPSRPSAGHAGAVFITGRFRSGSTLLWNLFRHIDGVTSYYEPLNERRWFDPTTRGDRIDPTHRQATEYWREYEGLAQLGEYYQESWIRRHLYMDAAFWDPALKRYIEILLEQSRGRPVLQFNRVDFRLPWLRSSFPDAIIIHLYRHPRDQWCSSLMDLRCFPKDGRMVDFAPHDKFYLLIWAQDLKYHFPFLDEQTARHPYQLFYHIWQLSYLFGRQYSHYSLAFEDLLADPRTKLVELLGAAEIAGYDLDRLLGLVEKPILGKWRDYAPDDWFSRHEQECESVLAQFFGQRRQDRSRSAEPVPTLTHGVPSLGDVQVCGDLR